MVCATNALGFLHAHCVHPPRPGAMGPLPGLLRYGFGYHAPTDTLGSLAGSSSSENAPSGVRVGTGAPVSDSRGNKRNASADHGPASRPSAHRSSGSQSSIPSTNLQILTINVNGWSKVKWNSIKRSLGFDNLDVIVLTEHHLSGTYCPAEIVKDGWDCSFVAGPLLQNHGNRFQGGVAILTKNSSNLTLQKRAVIDYTSGFRHQAATWTLTGPSLSSSLHITAVYACPSGGQVAEFFDTLKQQCIFPSHELHLFTGDFNSYCGVAVEDHLDPADDTDYPSRTGDARPTHQPSPADAPPSASDHLSGMQRGRLLRMLNELELLIANGRFQTPSCPDPPYTCYSAAIAGFSIVDYVLVPKTLFHYITSCRILPPIKLSTHSSRPPPGQVYH